MTTEQAENITSILKEIRYAIDDLKERKHRAEKKRLIDLYYASAVHAVSEVQKDEWMEDKE